MSINDRNTQDPWNTFRYVVVDLEGTGAQHREKESIVDIAGILILNGKVTNQIFQKLLDPGIEIPIITSRIHGIYNKDVEGRPLFEEIQDDLQNFLSDNIFVAQNAKVEERVLNLKLPRYRPPIILDTFKLSRKLYPEYPRHGLNDLIERFTLGPTLAQSCSQWKRHSACYDAIATAHAFVVMIDRKLPKGCPLGEIMSLCAINGPVPSEPNTSHSEAQGLLFDQQK
jgi:DNA polymerase III epsilon subunit-like protein